VTDKPPGVTTLTSSGSSATVNSLGVVAVILVELLITDVAAITSVPVLVIKDTYAPEKNPDPDIVKDDPLAPLKLDGDTELMASPP
jgi:hypothetical protein